MHFPISSLFALLLLGCLWTSHADSVAFIDAASKPYLKRTSPSRLSVEGYETLLSALSQTPAPFHVSGEVSKEVDAFVVSDIFQRPRATWNVVIFGATQSEVFQVKKLKREPTVKYVELFGTAPESGKLAPTNSVYKNCGTECLMESLAEGVTRVGGSYEEGDLGLNGVIKTPMCPAHRFELKLDSESLVFWAMELGALWKDLLTKLQEADGSVQLDSVLSGLYLIRRDYGEHSEEFRFACCFTKATLLEVHRTLTNYYDGRVFTSVLTHSTNEAIVDDKELEQAVIGHGRSLLTILRYSDTDPLTTVAQKTRRFSTNAVGYVMFLILLFSSLGSIYFMANMDFTKDTLLYSQAKID